MTARALGIPTTVTGAPTPFSTSTHVTPLPSTTATSGVLHPTLKDPSVQVLPPTSSKRKEQGHLPSTNSGPNEASNPSISPEAFHPRQGVVIRISWQQ